MVGCAHITDFGGMSDPRATGSVGAMTGPGYASGHLAGSGGNRATSDPAYGCLVIIVVLGAPGSGKTTVIEPLAALLPRHVLLDWDAFMEPAAALAGQDIRANPETWPAYSQLVKRVAASVASVPVVLFGVATPDELDGLPSRAWVLLDCSDEERRRRLRADGRGRDTDAAISDAQHYRSLGLQVIDTTARTPALIAADLADFVVRAEGQ
jgi:shikimate kinase